MGLGTADLLYLHNPAESQQGLVGRQEFMKVRTEREAASGCK